MGISNRTFSDTSDLQQMAALASAFPNDHLHVIDQPYRFSSWAFDEVENTQLWIDDAGNVVAWAVMQTPFWAIDYACHPAVFDEVHPRLLAWADDRARQLLGSDFARPCWFINAFSDQAEHISDLEAAGFASQANVAENPWSKVWMQQSTLTMEADQSLPAGFTIRPLAGATEVAAYVDLHQTVFGSRNMTVEWRARTLQQPAYRPDSDLVAVAADGRLAAFCIGWLLDDRNGKRGQIEPMGVHPDFQKLGLGRAILSEGLRRLYASGAEQIFVETDSYRDAAFALYESVGFRVAKDVLVFRKDYGE